MTSKELKGLIIEKGSDSGCLFNYTFSCVYSLPFPYLQNAA